MREICFALIWLRLKPPQEQRYPFLPVWEYFRVSRHVPVFGSFIVRADVDAFGDLCVSLIFPSRSTWFYIKNQSVTQLLLLDRN